MKNFTKSICLATAILATPSLYSQLLVDNTLTVEEYVNEYLLGEGVDAFNITFNGFEASTSSNVQIGSFNGVNTQLGMDEGLILATGNINVAVGPNNSGNASSPTTNPAGPDSDLSSLIPGFTLHDRAILEFDFIPSGDTVRFSYIWGSEEYPEFVNSSFNDVFGFFISGPGLNGPYTNNAVNIAIIPGSNPPMPVTIDNVNANLNSEFYISNTTGSNIQFDGYTVTMEALTAVQCGQLYHIKIALADAGDSGYDSAVFLEKGSFTSHATVAISAAPVAGGFEVGENDFNDGILAGCSDARFCLSRNDTIGIDTAYFEIAGSAIPGVQYILPEEEYVIFQEGEDTICFDIISVANDLGAQVDSLTFVASSIDACTGDTVFTSASIAVYNEYSFNVETEDIIIECPTDLVPISATGSQGLSPYSYSWALESDPDNIIGEGSTIVVEPPTGGGSDTYIVTVMDYCGLAPETATVTITDGTQPGPFISMSPTDTINCVGQTATLTAVGSMGHGELDYYWSTGDEAPVTTVAPDGSQTVTWYHITVIDECNVIVTDSVAVYFIPLEAPVAEAGGDQTVLCAGDEVELSGSASGGAAPYTYQWIDQNPGNVVNVAPEQTTTYYLQVTDNCGGVSDLDSMTVIVPVPDPITVNIPEVSPLCYGDDVTVTAIATGGTGSYDYEWTISGVNNPPNASSVTVSGFSTSFQVTVTDQCDYEGTGSYTMLVEPDSPITVIPESEPSCTGDSFTLSVSHVSGGVGNSPSDYSYFWQGPGLTDSTGYTTDGVLTLTNAETGTYSVFVTDVCMNAGTADVEADVIGVEFIPNVITPNGDYVNDQFVVPSSSIFDTKVTIMDRWGKVVFENDRYVCDQTDHDDPTTLINGNCWDGDDKQGDVFYYIIEVDNGACSFQGTLHILDNN